MSQSSWNPIKVLMVISHLIFDQLFDIFKKDLLNLRRVMTRGRQARRYMKCETSNVKSGEERVSDGDSQRRTKVSRVRDRQRKR